MRIVKKCIECGDKNYIEEDGKCFNCIKEDNPSSVLVGLHLDLCELDQWGINVVRKAQKNFPRIVHTKDFTSIKNYQQTELNVYKDFAQLEDFKVRYWYSNYDGRTEKQNVLLALQDAYRDAIEVKFET